jgi:hypothetical protein
MGADIQTALPRAANGLTLPLSRSLGLQDLQAHRAMLALELEVLSKKVDRFGWDRDRNSPSHDRLVIDWMDALHDFPLDEVRAACRAFVAKNPGKMPNEGHILAMIDGARIEFLRERARISPPAPEPPSPAPVSKEAAREILDRAGFTPKRLHDVRAAPMAQTPEEAERIADGLAFSHWTTRVAPDGPEMAALHALRRANPLMNANGDEDAN